MVEAVVVVAAVELGVVAVVVAVDGGDGGDGGGGAVVVVELGAASSDVQAPTTIVAPSARKVRLESRFRGSATAEFWPIGGVNRRRHPGRPTPASTGRSPSSGCA